MDSAEGDTQKLSGKRIGPGRSSGKWGSSLTPKVQPGSSSGNLSGKERRRSVLLGVLCAFFVPLRKERTKYTQIINRRIFMSELKRTQLYDAHVKAGATMVDFGGWEMPI